MYRVNLAFQYLYYKLFARHKYGHGIHSPFLYDFIRNVLNNKSKADIFKKIEDYRKHLFKRKESIKLKDFGAGNEGTVKKSRRLSEIAHSSPVNYKFGKMLYHLSAHFNTGTIIELGTSVGISTMYLAAGNPAAKVITIEGDKEIALLAEKEFRKQEFDKIEIIIDSFDNVLPDLDTAIKLPLIVFIDGNHKKDATVNYFNFFLERADSESILILDDIRWSKEMREAWKCIQSDIRVSLTVDLFFMGIIFLRKNMPKQNFIIKF